MKRISIALVLAGAAAAVGAVSLRAAACDDVAEFRKRRAEITARSLEGEDLARAQFTLGVWAREHSLPAEARTCFQAALAADADHEPAHAALGDVRLDGRWIPFAEAMAAKGLVQRDGRWILKEEAEILDLPAKERELRREQQAKVERLLGTYAAGSEAQRKFALASLSTVEDRFKVEPFAYALRARSEPVRLLAAKELGRLGSRRALQPLVKRAVLDPSEAVRDAAVDAAKEIGDANLIVPLARAMESESPQVRMNAAGAIARLGDVRGIKVLIWRLEAHGGTGQRVNFSQIHQLTYIQDFDVEVAQTAFIADPIIGILQEGVVLDAQIVSVDTEITWAEREVIHGAVTRLTGASGVKNERGAWAAWWKEHAKDYEQPVADAR